VKLAILGGSSPFTVALLEALAVSTLPFADPATYPVQITLHGRQREPLEAVAAFGRSRLDERHWSVVTATDLASAVEQASVVVNQVRFGGMDGRAGDERLAAELGVPPDETLGPSGLSGAIRVAPHMVALGEVLAARCSNAIVFNLSNPLSVTTTLLHGAGVNAIGLCELPVITVGKAQRMLGLPGQVEWEYEGFNHRGFVVSLRHEGRDYLAELPRAMAADTIGGVTAHDVESLRALPLKYFTVSRRHGPVGKPRAAYLDALRRRILAQLAVAPDRYPTAARERDMPWYEMAVVPALRALSSPLRSTQVVNVARRDGLVHEVRADIDREGVYERPAGVAVSPAARGWLDRFGEHERLVVDAVHDPSVATVAAALAADPLISSTAPGASAVKVLDAALGVRR